MVLREATDPFARIATYYGELVREYGHDVRACDYGRPQSQEIKFRVLSEVMPLDHCRVLDVGCGFGDFYHYLTARFSDVRYQGIDVCPAMVKEARRIKPELDVQVANVLDYVQKEPTHLVTANGIFYLLGEEAWPLMQRIVARMFDQGQIAVAFNSLSSWAEDKEEGEFYADPLEVVEFCRSLTPWVTLRHDYHARDFTIYMYKAART